jgi:hypothetical protein
MIRVFLCIVTLNTLAALATLGPQAQAATAPSGPPPVSGCLNQNLTDGFWDFKVTSIKLGTIPTTDITAWNVAFIFGNAGSQASTPNDYGVGSPSFGVGEPLVFLKDGSTLDMNTGSVLALQREILYNSFQPGSSKSVNYWFPLRDATAKPTMFVLPVSPVGGFFNRSFGYTLKNPSFSVDLTCKK